MSTPWRRRRWLVVGAVAVALGASALAIARAGRAERPRSLPAPARAEPAAGSRPADFAGARTCAECHAALYAAWTASTHGRARQSA